MSQMTSLVKAQKAVGKGSVLVTTEAVTPRNAQAPTGRGLRTSPATVERKMARSCHAWRVSSGGLGTAKRRRSPTETEIIKGRSFAPPLEGAEVLVEGGSADEDAVALRGLRARRGLEEREREGLI